MKKKRKKKEIVDDRDREHVKVKPRCPSPRSPSAHPHLRPATNPRIPTPPPPPAAPCSSSTLTHSHSPTRSTRGSPPTSRKLLCLTDRGGCSAARASPRRASSRPLSACRAARAPPVTGAWSWSASSRTVPGRGALASTTRSSCSMNCCPTRGLPRFVLSTTCLTLSLAPDALQPPSSPSPSSTGWPVPAPTRCVQTCAHTASSLVVSVAWVA